MSHLLPHPPYAEDQPYAHAILTTHVLSRAFQTGAVIGSTTALFRTLILKHPWTTALDRIGRGALIGTAIFIPGLPLYMRGKSDIEWKDRTWRLLENKGQMEVDGWSSVGFVVGGAVAGLRGGGRMGLVRVVGGAAVGDLVGVMGYLGWRYGVHGGKWPEVRE